MARALEQSPVGLVHLLLSRFPRGREGQSERSFAVDSGSACQTRIARSQIHAILVPRLVSDLELFRADHPASGQISSFGRHTGTAALACNRGPLEAARRGVP